VCIRGEVDPRARGHVPLEKADGSRIRHGSFDHDRDGACRPADDRRRHARLRADDERRASRGRGRDGSGRGGADRGGRRQRQQWRRRFCGGGRTGGARPGCLGHPAVRARQPAGRRGARRTRLEVSGAAVQPPGDRQAGLDHRCAVRRRPQSARQGRSARDDRGGQRQRSTCRAGSMARPAP
jgi:hypothetical protein